MRSPNEEIMGKEIKNFFHTQLNEHELILKLKIKKKLFFLEMEEVHQTHSI